MSAHAVIESRVACREGELTIRALGQKAQNDELSASQGLSSQPTPLSGLRNPDSQDLEQTAEVSAHCDLTVATQWASARARPRRPQP